MASRLSCSSRRLLQQKPRQQLAVSGKTLAAAASWMRTATTATSFSSVCPLVHEPRCRATKAQQQQQQQDRTQQEQGVWGATPSSSPLFCLLEARKSRCSSTATLLNSTVGCQSSSTSSKSSKRNSVEATPVVWDLVRREDSAATRAISGRLLRLLEQQRQHNTRGFSSSSRAAAKKDQKEEQKETSSSGAAAADEEEAAAAADEEAAAAAKHTETAAVDARNTKETATKSEAETAAAAASAHTQETSQDTKEEKHLQQSADKETPVHSGKEEGEEVHAFRAETKKLMQIVTHSLYTDKEVFIRELISNSADALEKLRFLQTTSAEATDPTRASLPLQIYMGADPAKRTFTLEDTGVGMTKAEMLEHLGTIAKSGSLEFLMQHHQEQNSNIIGQFGVGFYSSFIVSDRVDVISRSHAPGSKTYMWSSDGGGEFSIKELAAEGETGLVRGTKVICHLKKDCLEFANVHTLQSCANKFSSFINFPIAIKEESGKELAVTTQEALWLKPKATEEEHTQFFRYLSNQSWGQPMYSIAYRADAPLSIKALFYVPEDPPSRLFQSSNEVGVALHARRVLVQRAAVDVIPRWLSFLRGVVDCDDMPLNVSRERMQNSALMEKLSQVLVKRILRFFHEQAQSDPKKYISFYWKYAQHLKEGVLDDAHNGSRYKNELLQLLRFQCSEKEEGELISLDQYLEIIKPEQQNIYVYCCPGRETALASPYMEQFKEKKRPVLLLTDDIDEFVTMNVQTFKGKKFVAIDSPEEDFEPLLEEQEKDADCADTTASLPGLVGVQKQELERFVQSTLGSGVSAVKFSDRLVKTPAVVTGFLSSTLRKMMKATLQGAPEAQLKMASLPVTLELNPRHQLVSSIYHLMRSNADVAKLLVEQLYDNARVAAGLMEDPRCMVERLNQLLEMTAQYAYHYGKADISAAAEQTEAKPTDGNTATGTEATAKAADSQKTDAEKSDTSEKESTGSTIHL